MPRLLDLFSGTGSVSRCYRDAGWEVFSLDNEPKFNADFLMDIRDFNEMLFPNTFFDHVHASPVCTEFSRALTSRTRDLDAGDSLVLPALRIINYFVRGGATATLENPLGMLKDRPYMQGLDYQLVDYCKYSQYPYRKRTMIWTWGFSFPPRVCRHDCHSCNGSKVHRETAQRGANRLGSGRDKNRHTQTELYSIPRDLVNDILTYSTRMMVRRYDEVLALLEEIEFPTHKFGRQLTHGSKCFTLGTTLNSRGRQGFAEILPNGKGVNRRIVPRLVDQILGLRLWFLLKAEIQDIEGDDWDFTSVQINKNFVGKPHRDKNDTSYQYACSLGDFEGGELHWIEGSRDFQACTKNRWVKFDGRAFMHYVTPYEGTRYSIILFRNTDCPPHPVFSHS